MQNQQTDKILNKSIRIKPQHTREDFYNWHYMPSGERASLKQAESQRAFNLQQKEVKKPQAFRPTENYLGALGTGPLKFAERDRYARVQKEIN